MATYVQPAPQPRALTRQFFNFLRAEIALPAGMYSTLTRVVIAVVITFLIVATFRMPYAAISLYSVLTIDRSSRRAALIRAFESLVFISFGLAVALLGVTLFADFPLLTFCWYALELFLVAFLIRIVRLPGPALNMGMAVYSVHNVWEHAYPAGPHLEQTLWVWLTLCLGFVVSVVVEFAFVREHPLQQILAQLTGRLRALSYFFGSVSAQAPDAAVARERLLSYADLGTATVRQRIASLRNTDPAIHQQLLILSTITALIARLIDVSATIDPSSPPSEGDISRLAALSGELDRIGAALEAGAPALSAEYQPVAVPSARIPALPELERTAALIPTAFSTTAPLENEPGAELLDTEEHLRVFVPDAFANRDYVLFALKTMLAAMLAYVIYSALDWPGLSTSVVTCLVTALTTSGAAKQRQILRLAGATFGGAIALGSIVFLLPEFDSITSIALLIAAVSAFSGWVVLASQRLSYFGMQTALAFYLALIQDYSATTQLAPARDRAIGVLLGIAMMWLVFDNLWPVSAADQMRTGLAQNIRLLAQLITALDQPDRAAAIQTIRNLRDRIQQGVTAVHTHADSVVFEFGSPERSRQLALRDSVLRLQATLRTLFVVEIAICQYRTQVVPGTRPPAIREAQRQFDEAFSARLLHLGEAVEDLRAAVIDSPLREALARLEAVTGPWARSVSDQWIQSRVSGITALTRQAVQLADNLSEQCAWC